MPYDMANLSSQERIMTRLTTIRPDAATGATAEVFAKIKKAVGKDG
jgi:hypothetical protein